MVEQMFLHQLDAGILCSEEIEQIENALLKDIVHNVCTDGKPHPDALTRFVDE